ncbi:MAG: MFS transporter [Desulfatirhabdiaceae bacterium]
MNELEINCSQSDAPYFRWAILAMLTGSQFTMSLGAYAWGPLSPFLVNELNISHVQLGMFNSALFMASGIISIPSGFFVDRFGARPSLIICLIIMGFSFVLLALTKNYLLMVIFSFIGGLGYGIINQVSVKGIIQWFGSRTRGTAMGIKQTGVTLGVALGGVLLPALAVSFNWNIALLAAGLPMLGLALIALFFYRECPADDAGGSADAGSTPGHKPEAIKKASFLQILANPVIISLVVTGPLLTLTQSCVMTFLVLYLTENIRLSVNLSGVCLTIIMIAGTIGRIVWTFLSDRFFCADRKKPLIVICLLSFISSLGLAYFPADISVWVIFFWVVLMGFCFLGWNALFYIMAAEVAGPELTGSITGVVLTMGWAGMVIGPLAFGWILDVTGGYFWGWLMVAFCSALCAFLLVISASTLRLLKGQPYP